MNQVAHPSSPDYGRHWSKEKAADMFAPTKETVEAVKEWLHSLGIDPSRIRMSKSRILAKLQRHSQRSGETSADRVPPIQARDGSQPRCLRII